VSRWRYVALSLLLMAAGAVCSLSIRNTLERGSLLGNVQAIAARADALDTRLRDEFERGMAVGYARGVDSVRDDFGAVVEMVGIIADGCVYLPQSQRLGVTKGVGR
jgi:hypothetical protein